MKMITIVSKTNDSENANRQNAVLANGAGMRHITERLSVLVESVEQAVAAVEKITDAGTIALVHLNVGELLERDILMGLKDNNNAVVSFTTLRY